MDSRPIRALVAAALLVAAAAGCSTDEAATPPTDSVVPPGAATSGAQSAPEQPGAAVGRSPAGVTTSMQVPADSTEDDFYDLCITAKTWIGQRGGDPLSQVEPYLAMVQQGDAPSPGSFGARWSELSPGQQSAVVYAAGAAARGEC